MKFEIFQNENKDKFYFRLKAANHQTILSSEAYNTKEACKNGIASVQKNAKEGKYDQKEAANGKFHFNLLAANHQIIGSSQMYASKDSMKKGIAAVQKADTDTPVIDLTLA